MYRGVVPLPAVEREREVLPVVTGRARAVRRRLERTVVLRLGESGPDLDGATEEVTAVQLRHCLVSLLFGLQLHEAIGGVPASKRVYRDIDALAKRREKEATLS